MLRWSSGVDRVRRRLIVRGLNERGWLNECGCREEDVEGWAKGGEASERSSYRVELSKS